MFHYMRVSLEDRSDFVISPHLVSVRHVLIESRDVALLETYFLLVLF